MNKSEFIGKYGETAYARKLAQKREWNKQNPERDTENHRRWREENSERVAETRRRWAEGNPQKIIQSHREASRKGGEFYEKRLEYDHTGIPGDKNKIRGKHRREYKPYKDIIAPESQIHHQWKPNSAEYVAVALVEKDAHMRGFINVIEILDGEVNIFTEKKS
jgi:hypothetical protein